MAFKTPAPQEIIIPADILADRGYHGPDLCYRLAPDDPRTGYSHYVCADNPPDQLPQHRAGHELGLVKAQSEAAARQGTAPGRQPAAAPHRVTG